MVLHRKIVIQTMENSNMHTKCIWFSHHRRRPLYTLYSLSHRYTLQSIQCCVSKQPMNQMCRDHKNDLLNNEHSMNGCAEWTRMTQFVIFRILVFVIVNHFDHFQPFLSNLMTPKTKGTFQKREWTKRFQADVNFVCATMLFAVIKSKFVHLTHIKIDHFEFWRIDTAHNNETNIHENMMSIKKITEDCIVLMTNAHTSSNGQS